MITFIHTADWQIGKPFASITDPAKRARVQQERIEAIRRIGDVVRQRQARFVVVAGDLFDSPTPTNATVASALGAIASLEVPVYCIPGNHDHGGPDSLWEQPFFKREHGRLAANFHLLLEPRPVVVASPGSDPASVLLLPCPLRRRHEADDPTAWIRSLDFAAFGETPRIVIAHGSTTVFAAGSTAAAGSLGGGPGSSGQLDDEEPAGTGVNTIALDRLPLDELDYLALGDWHGFLAAGPKAFYSGAPEIDRFPKPGQQPGHVAVVTVARAAEPRVEPVATGCFRWLTGSVSLAERAELDRLVESWTARLLRLDLDDQTVLAPSADEIRELAERPSDPIIARVAGELVAMLEQAAPAADPSLADPEVIRHAIHLLHAVVSADEETAEPPSATGLPTGAAIAASAAPAPQEAAP